jgi:hypothetical protein
MAAECKPRRRHRIRQSDSSSVRALSSALLRLGEQKRHPDRAGDHVNLSIIWAGFETVCLTSGGKSEPVAIKQQVKNDFSSGYDLVEPVRWSVPNRRLFQGRAGSEGSAVNPSTFSGQ